MRKVYAIYLAYYPDVRGRGMSQFFKQVKFITGSNPVECIVNNSGIDYPKNTIPGDNRAWEFSGFQKGIDYLGKKMEFVEGDIFVIANDTYSSHRNFSMLDLLCYKMAVNRIRLEPTPFIIGEKCLLDKPSKVSGLDIDSWVSTYFFVANGRFIKNMGGFVKFGDSDGIEVSDRGVEFGGAVDDDLCRHINRWLFPEGEKGWYRAKNSDSALLKKKAISILNEKYLSAKCIAVGGQLYDVYSSWLGKVTKKINKRLVQKHANLGGK